MALSNLGKSAVAAGALAVSFAPVDIGYGLIVFQMLGHGYEGLGVASGWLGVLVSTAFVALRLNSGHIFTSVRPAQTLSLAALLGLLMHSHTFTSEAEKVALGLLAVMVCTASSGLIQMLMGYAHVGRLVSFIPRAVLSGVASAAAIGLALNAVKTLFRLFSAGFVLPPSVRLWEAPGFATQALLWLAFIAVVLALMNWAAKHLVSLNWSLVGLCSGVVAYWGINSLLPNETSLPLLGATLPAISAPSQLPFFMSAWTLAAHPDTLPQLVLLALPYAFVIAIINSLEALVYNARFERSTEIVHDPRKLLIALGQGNFLGGVLGGLPVSCSSTKMALAYQSGVRDLKGVGFHTLMLVGLILATPLYVHLIPKLAVSLVMLYLSWVMLDAWSRVQLFGWLRPSSLMSRIKDPHSTPIIFLVVLASALSSNLAWGVAVGLLCAVFVFVQRQSQSVVRRCGSIFFRRSVVTRNAAQNECLKLFSSRVIFFELQGALFFGTSEQLLKEIRGLMDADTEMVILDARKVLEIDDSGCETIERLQGDMLRRGGALVLSGWNENVQRVSRLEVSHLKQAIRQPSFRSLDEAIEFAEDVLIKRHGSEEAKSEVYIFDPEGKQLRLIQAVPQELRARLLSNLQHCEFADGQHVFHRGDQSNHMYIVVCGRVDIWLNHAREDAVRLASFRHGVSFGEMGLLRNEARTADAVAVGEVQALSLSRESLDLMRRESPNLLAHVLETINEDLAHRLGQTNGALRLALE